MGSEVLGAQQCPDQVAEQASADGACHDQVEHGASDAVATGNIGDHQREGAEAKGEKEDIEHGASLPAGAGELREDGRGGHKGAIRDGTARHKNGVKRPGRPADFVRALCVVGEVANAPLRLGSQT
jgi:hypothetical protein